MPNIDLHRTGYAGQSRNIPEPVPADLDAYPWPKAIKAKLKASDDAYIAIDTANMLWDEAQSDLYGPAPLRDQDALRTSLRAGNGDPGTPETDKAKRAEEVAWQQLEIAVEDAQEPMRAAQQAVAEYLEQHAAEIAEYEIAQWEAAVEAQRLAEEAAQDAENARRAVGRLYVNARWFTGETFQPEQYMVSDSNFRDASNVQVRERYEAMQAGSPDPAVAMAAPVTR